MKTLFWILLFALPRLSSPPDASAQSATAPGSGLPAAQETSPSAFERLRQECFECGTSLSPEWASTLGLAEFRSKLSDLSDAKLHEQVGRLEAIESALGRTPPTSAQERIDHAVMLSFVRGKLRYLRDRKGYRKDLSLALAPYESIQAQLSQIEPGREGLEEWRAVAARVERIPAYLSQLTGHLREGVKSGQVPDRRMLEEEGIRGARGSAGFFGRELEGAARDALPPETFEGLRERLRAAGGGARAAYEAFAAFLEAELLPRSTESFAVGAEEYAWHLRNGFGIDEPLDELYRKGFERAEALGARMVELARGIDPLKDLPGVMADLKKDHPADDEALFKAYEAMVERARRFVVEKGLFEVPDGYRLKVLATPPGMRARNTIALEVPPPPFDSSKKGGFFVTPSEGRREALARHNHAFMASVAVHEAFPGHDLQFDAFRRSKATIPPVRYLTLSRLGSTFGGSLHVEGWALYAEELMRERGFFSPKEELAQLQSQLWRAWRVVVDIGLHTGRLGFDEAVRILSERVFLPEAVARGEAFRYSRMATQAASYLLGRLQIESLKRSYREIVGERFSEAEFHKRLLGYGPVPPSQVAPSMLEEARKSVREAEQGGKE